MNSLITFTLATLAAIYFIVSVDNIVTAERTACTVTPYGNTTIQCDTSTIPLPIEDDTNTLTVT